MTGSGTAGCMYPDLREHTCCFTGHRAVARSHEEELSELLEEHIRVLVAMGVYRFVTGGALGFDTMAARAVLKMRGENERISLTVIAPYAGQSDSWGTQDLYEYERIKNAADEFICLEAGYSRGCMRRRNRAMVDMSAVCVAYMLYKRSGTSQTYDYAVQSGLRVVNLADELRGGEDMFRDQ